MCVAIGASCAFLSPIGHQCNTLVMGPGNYKFGDYWKLGLPLELLIIAISTPLLLIFGSSNPELLFLSQKVHSIENNYIFLAL